MKLTVTFQTTIPVGPGFCERRETVGELRGSVGSVFGTRHMWPARPRRSRKVLMDKVLMESKDSEIAEVFLEQGDLSQLTGQRSDLQLESLILAQNERWRQA